MTDIELSINGKTVRRSCEDHRLLVSFLREDLGLTGTHIGCDTTQCGACVVSVDGDTVKSCTMLAVQAHGRAITTIEGVSNGAALHAVQDAFHRHHALQCGYCTAGLVITAIDLIAREGRKLTRETVAHALKGNLCRCTGYQNIITAILDAAGCLETPGQAAQ
ncbi:(2Fe-2S)-binding protein [Neorhizobium sp. S3-V5DH]|uniref:(2Fe-2S)-binding protein n=1 Tax=Neorhizobium sp. S3-V5DH TaxID=2485166 RepID=UPI001049C887|nr:(2Fe-2S)-binding protein [Neorhizobium sp. S3-V5DH]TCV68640.1 carbon-monoxide dehydrogenase small subunit [Neorhizobium sp. S3-V5DH]